MTLAPEAHCFWEKSISYVFGDIRNMIFRDEVFDDVVCLSTLEHVGLDNRRFHSSALSHNTPEPESHLLAMRELRRVLKHGGRCFVSVPYGQREQQPWQQIFNSEMVDKLVRAFGPESYNETYFRYSEPDGWMHCEKSAAAHARYFNFQSDKPWKGHPAAAEAVACLELRK
jgi:ubiquinone/menaquinone biosynthesis C-methylase UbiE